MTNNANVNNQRLLTTILKETSRSFYLSMRILPSQIRSPISIAYLLARAADTIADTELVSPQTRRSCLQKLANKLTSKNPDTVIQLEEFKPSDNPSEAVLLQQLPEVFKLYEHCNTLDKQKIAKVVATLIEGMLMDLDRFPNEQSQDITALSTAAELDRYTYLVAGCVGEFWTDVCISHDPAYRPWKTESIYQQQMTRGIRLGKALQLTNILRDLAKDLRIGRCYLPQQQLQALNLSPQDLLSTQHAHSAQPLLEDWRQQALEHFQAGIDYALMIPRRCVRQRLAVFWPILIGLATLNKLADNDDWLRPSKPIKVSRPWVYKMMLRSLFLCASNKAMSQWFRTLQNTPHVKLD